MNSFPMAISLQLSRRKSAFTGSFEQYFCVLECSAVNTVDGPRVPASDGEVKQASRCLDSFYQFEQVRDCLRHKPTLVAFDFDVRRDNTQVSNCEANDHVVGEPDLCRGRGAFVSSGCWL